MNSFSQKLILLTFLATGILFSSLAIAAVNNVANTKHNFSATAVTGGSGVYKSKSIGQVCIFCHTPHNAGKTRLLWNKASNSAPAFRLYTSSSTLTTVTRKQSIYLTGNSTSLLCLSCHDGKTAMNVLHNSNAGLSASAAGDGYGAGTKYIDADNGVLPLPMPGPQDGSMYGFAGFMPSMNLGRAPDGTNDTLGNNLTDDHPIGFSYSDVLTERSAGLNSIASAKAAGVRFFGTNNVVECSTCHDPHVDYSAAGNTALKPFLVMSNSGSALCLSCHNK